MLSASAAVALSVGNAFSFSFSFFLFVRSVQHRAILRSLQMCVEFERLSSQRMQPATATLLYLHP